MPEWLNGTVSKTVERVSVPRVRISLFPQLKNCPEEIRDFLFSGRFFILLNPLKTRIILIHLDIHKSQEWVTYFCYKTHTTIIFRFNFQLLVFQSFRLRMNKIRSCKYLPKNIPNQKISYRREIPQNIPEIN